jgi:NACalpha-BTF3-like transcription factor
LEKNGQYKIKERNYWTKLYEANQKLRRKSTKNLGMGHKELIQVCKNEILGKDDKIILPRASFILRKKTKRGLKNYSDKITQTFRIAEDHAETEDEFEVTSGYIQYQMRKHINDTIAEKHENTRPKRNLNGQRKDKNIQLFQEMEELTKRREILL